MIHRPAPRLATKASSEDRQQQELPARHKLVPDHQRDQNGEADEEIDEGDHHRGDRHDQPRKIHFADEIGIADQAVGGVAQTAVAKKVHGSMPAKTISA